jgi:uncharacterized protein YkwD
MKNEKILGLVCCGLLLVGCGGGTSSTNPSSCEIDPTNIQPKDINLTAAINDNNIRGYSDATTLEGKYVAVINYLRSMKIQCQDPSCIVGPSESNMTWNEDLADAAKEHSDDMALSIYYNGNHTGSGTENDITGQSFTSPRKSEFYERIKFNNYNGTLTAENIAKSVANYEISEDTWLSIVEGWMNSEHGHCSNIMNPELTNIGMYETRAEKDENGTYRVYWTQDFGKPQ